MLSAKPERMAFIPTFMTEPMACMTELGRPTAKMSRILRRWIRKSAMFSFSSLFFVWFRIKPISADSHWPATVATAAPETPMAGKPR